MAKNGESELDSGAVATHGDMQDQADGHPIFHDLLEEFVEYHDSRVWPEREAERWVYRIKKQDDSYDAWLERLFGPIERPAEIEWS